MSHPLRDQELIERIRALPEAKIAEVEDFVDFLYRRLDDRRLTEAAGRLSEEALRQVWDNPDDEAYDNL